MGLCRLAIHLKLVLYLLISEKRLFNRYIPILNRVAESIEDILRYHKESFDKLDTLVTRKYRFSKKKEFVSHTTRPQWRPFNLSYI